MASFKLCISDPSSGRTFQREVKDNEAKPFIGLNIGESIKGDTFGFSECEFMVTGGSDYCGFPMRRGILGLRKKITIYGGVGYKGGPKGIKKRKTVCGHKIYERTSQINLKLTKQGSKKLAEIFGVEDKKEAKPDVKDEKKHTKAQENKEQKEEVKEQKAEEKSENKEEKKEIKEQKKEKHVKAEEKKE